jgi:serine/threonine protein kinase/tetratricopeptide (TPR) repeat protein
LAEHVEKMSLDAGTKLGRYEIRTQIGKGGMGEVYLAQDTELDRTVAIKILPPDVADDQQRLQRFVQEAKAASALNHPHIITIYEIGSENDSKYIVTEFIDGETLRQRMNSGMRLLEVLEIGSQIASALVAAHSAGIVHRDIKPENVMVRRDGYAKVLDFGLAKLTDASMSSADTEAPTRAMVNTGAGTVMGTATYMSPEQAKGVTVDARTDLWSLGALLYEMTSGHVPFKGETPTETISLILQKDPPPMARYADDIPEELDRIVTKALTKDLDERYQTAKDFLIDLRHLKRKIEVDAEIDRTVPPEIRSAASTHSHPGASTASGANLTQSVTSQRSASSAEYIVSEIRQHRKGFLIAGIAAVLLIAAAGAFYFVKSTPALTDKDTILLADFVNTTGEAVFDGTLNQALSVQLGQSPYLNIFPDDRVREALRFMGRQPNERVTRDIAKEICQRNGIKAMILGSIAGLGSHYVLTLEAINAADGTSIAKEQVEADSKEHVLTSLGKAATSIREKLGESLTSIKKYDAPVEQATTSSLDALKAYTQATEIFEQGDNPGAIPWFKKAIEIDPNFAMAYARLAVIYNNGFQADLGEQYSQKAYDLRNRVSERERFYIEEKYTSYVTGDREEAIKVLKSWVQTYPNDFIPHNNLSVNYALFGKWDDAMAEAKEAVRLSPNNVVPKTNLVEGFMRQSRFDEAQQTLDQLLGDNTERGSYRFYSYAIAFSKGDIEAANKSLEYFAKKTTDPDYTDSLSGMAAFAGQWKKSLDFAAKSFDLYVKDDRKENAAQIDGSNAFIESQLGLCDKAKAHVDKALAVYKSRSTLPVAALALTACNDPRGLSIIDDQQKRYPKDSVINRFFAPLVKALAESNKGNTAAAIDASQPIANIELGNLTGFWFNWVRGQIFLRGKMGSEAAAEFRKILDHRGLETTSPFYNLSHVGLARALILTGDTSTARTEYQNFFAAWKDADQDLPIVIDAKKEYEQIK